MLNQSLTFVTFSSTGTSHAECRNSGLSRGCTLTSQTKSNMLGRIDLAISETNTAYDLSGVNTELRLVHSYLHPNYTEASSDTFGTALDDITGTSDEKMDDVHAKREQYGADLVALLIDGSQYCGIAWLGPSKGNMFSVTAWNCATGYYSFGHEIGHNMVSTSRRLRCHFKFILYTTNTFICCLPSGMQPRQGHQECLLQQQLQLRLARPAG